MTENVSFLDGALLLSIISYLGYQLKNVPNIIYAQIKRRLIFKATIEETDELFIYMERWLKEYHGEKYRNIEVTLKRKETDGGGSYLGEPENEETLSRRPEDELHFWQYDDYFIIHYNAKKLIINKGREKLEAAKDLKSAYFNRFSISGWRAKSCIDSLLRDVVEYNQQFVSKVPPMMKVADKWGNWCSSGKVKSKTMNNIFVKEKENLLLDIDRFSNSRPWYESRGIPYKRGYIFYGLPGNGKTALCMALANHLDKDLHFLSFGIIDSDDELRKLFRNLTDSSILVLEDIDALFVERENNGDSKSITFSGLLNCLDGAFSKEGVITIMTTNHIEKLDPALIRAGRIDIHLEVTNPTRENAQHYIQKFFENSELKLSNYVDGSMPMVNIQDICLQNKEDAEKAVEALSTKRIERPAIVVDASRNA